MHYYNNNHQNESKYLFIERKKLALLKPYFEILLTVYQGNCKQKEIYQKSKTTSWKKRWSMVSLIKERILCFFEDLFTIFYLKIK